MTGRAELWEAVRTQLRADHWTSLGGLYGAIEMHLTLDSDDRQPARAGSKTPRWQRNVRNVLQHRKSTGEVLWDGHGSYRLAASE
jgi:hypothetical protein